MRSLKAHEREHGYKTYLETRVRLASGVYRIPDITVVRRPVARQKYLENPFLVVEVVSPDDRCGCMLAMAYGSGCSIRCSGARTCLMKRAECCRRWRPVLCSAPACAPSRSTRSSKHSNKHSVISICASARLRSRLGSPM
ncbi:MAG: Uma2 family endonuclease [Acidobacteria bacterium]|nr:Uma2 family endonuclease [Acidobacteriota bacterium]